MGTRNRSRQLGAWRIAAAISLAALASGSGAADSICAARPGKATPPCTLQPGRFQLETGIAGWSLQKDGGTRDTSLAVGDSALRIGLTDRSELQLGVTPWQRMNGASGFGDSSIAYKQRLTAEGAGVEVAMMPAIKLPTASRALGNGKVEGALLLPVGIAVGDSPLGIGLTPEIDWAADADGRGHHAAMAQVASLGWQASATLTLSAELWAQWDWDPAGTVRQASADAAVAYLVNHDLQLDAGANLGLNKATPDVELYVGVAKRF